MKVTYQGHRTKRKKSLLYFIKKKAKGINWKALQEEDKGQSMLLEAGKYYQHPTIWRDEKINERLSKREIKGLAR